MRLRQPELVKFFNGDPNAFHRFNNIRTGFPRRIQSDRVIAVCTDGGGWTAVSEVHRCNIPKGHTADPPGCLIAPGTQDDRRNLTRLNQIVFGADDVAPLPLVHVTAGNEAFARRSVFATSVTVKPYWAINSGSTVI